MKKFFSLLLFLSALGVEGQTTFSGLTSGGISVLSEPSIQPIISGSALDFLNRHVDVSFDPDVYHSTGGGALAADFQLIFTQNGGTATNCTIASITNISGGALVGGENTIRINLTLTGDPSGVEFIEITPTSGAAIKDSNGSFFLSNATTGEIVFELTYESEYQEILEYAENNTITYPVKTQRLIDNTLIINLKSSGGWEEFDYLFFLANNLDTEFALIDWKNPGVIQPTISSPLTWTSEKGVQSGGAGGYIDLNRNALTNSVKYLQNDASAWVYIATNAAGALNSFGARGSASGVNFGATNFNARNSSDASRFNINVNSSTAGETVSGQTNSIGLWVLSRETSNQPKLYKNGALIHTGTAVSSTLSDQNDYVCAANENGTATNFDIQRIIGFVAKGSGMQDIISTVSGHIETWIDATDTPPTETGRLYLLAGQSGMDGRGNVAALPGYLTGPLDRCYVWWNGAWEQLEAGVNASTQEGFGPIISFAYDESQKHPADNLYFVINATGGTSLATDWIPDTGLQYQTLIAKYNSAVQELNVTSFEGFFWYQGEGDARTLSYANAYEVNEQTFISSVFADTDFTTAIVININSGLPSGDYPYTATVRTAKDNNYLNTYYDALLETNDLPFEASGVHLTSAGYITIGERMSASL